LHFCATISLFTTPLPHTAERELERTTLAVADVQRRLDAQELSPADVERMAVKKQQLREQYATLRDEAARVEGEVDRDRTGVTRALAKLQGVMAEYTALAHKVQLLPVGAKYAFGVDFGVKLQEGVLDAVSDGTLGLDASLVSNTTGDYSLAAAGSAASAATTTALLGADLKHGIKPQLRELRAKMARQATEHTRTVLELTEAVAAQVEAKAEAHARMEMVRAACRGGSHELIDRTPPPHPTTPMCS